MIWTTKDTLSYPMSCPHNSATTSSTRPGNGWKRWGLGYSEATRSPGPTTAGHKIITASFKVTGLATRLSCGKRGQTRTSQVCSRKSGALRNCWRVLTSTLRSLSSWCKEPTTIVSGFIQTRTRRRKDFIASKEFWTWRKFLIEIRP